MSNDLTAAQCDFCGKKWSMMDHRWMCHHCRPVQIRTEQDVVYNADPQWLVCHECNALIEQKEWKALAVRAADTHPDRKVTDYRWLVRTCYAINQAFANSWIRSHFLHEERDCLVRLPQVH